MRPYLVPVFTMCGDGGGVCEFRGVMVGPQPEELDEGKGERSWVGDSGALCRIC